MTSPNRLDSRITSRSFHTQSKHSQLSPREQYHHIIASLPSPVSNSIDLPRVSYETEIDTWMTSSHDFAVYPSFRIEDSDYTLSQPSLYNQALNNTFQIPRDWQMYQGLPQSMGSAALAFHHNQGQQAGYTPRGHRRQASDSTVASNGPDSPYAFPSTFPHIANTDRSPSASYNYGDDSLNYTTKARTADNFPAFQVGYMPSALSHTPAAHSAMKDMAIEHHNVADDVPDFASSRQSGSTHGRNTPVTPRTTTGVTDDLEDRVFKTSSNEYRQAPRVELYRTESAAYQDELYNPANFMSQPSTKTEAPRAQIPAAQNNLLTPHRNLVSERIQTANSVRSQSPGQQPARERSPFRHGSHLAPAEEYASPGPVLDSAGNVRRRQRDLASAEEYARHQPPLRREPTKTISPKDAFLDYNDQDPEANAPLFNDTIPQGYERHYGGTETYPNNFISGTNQAFGQFAQQSQMNMANFRSADGSGNNTGFVYPPSSNQSQSQPLAAPQYRPGNNTNLGVDPTPEFPAHLTSMESSVSDNPPASSQESAFSPIQRPANTSANTGTYTCSYDGCSQRFESPAKLTKHKRDSHQPQQEHHQRQYSHSTSPVDDEEEDDEDDDSHSGMTSSALLARNSQAGPHKCSRINPSTGKPCNTIFSRPYDLTRHEDTIHNRGKQKVRCQFCREEKTFSRNDALTRHMRVVHPEVDFQGKRSRRDY